MPVKRRDPPQAPGSASTASEGAAWEVFIAYADNDEATADRLHRLLVDHVRVFVASRCLSLGDDWDQSIAAAQANSLISVILVSQHTNTAFYQREEVAAAIEMSRKAAGHHRVVPVYLPDAAGRAPDPPYGLRTKQGVVIHGVEDLRRLAEQLRGLAGPTHAGGRGSEFALDALEAAAPPDPPTLLWVDDHGPDRFLNDEYLIQERGWTIEWAASVAEAVEKLSSCLYDCAIVDQLLPLYRGGEFPIPTGGACVVRWLRGATLPEPASLEHHPFFGSAPLDANKDILLAVASAYFDTEAARLIRTASPADATLVWLHKPVSEQAIQGFLSRVETQ